jgi:hypothetical protein
MTIPGGVIALAAEVRRTGRRQDTGRPRQAVPDTGTHFVTMVKPEVLAAGTTVDAMAEVLRVLDANDVTVLRCALMPARRYGELGFLLQHYPRLYRVATDGVRALSAGARCGLAVLLERSGTTAAAGAFDAAAHEPELSAGALEARCRQAGIRKLGSGSYASIVELNRTPVAVLNGFMPALAASYLDSAASVGLIECHSDQEVASLRTDLLGDLDPATASPGSLRGALAASVGRGHGIALSEGRNGVHLSAGHLEGMFQTWRYFTAADGHGLDRTALGRSLAQANAPLPAVAALAADHNVVDESGDVVSPHGETENLRRDEVVDRVVRWTTRQKGFRA